MRIFRETLTVIATLLVLALIGVMVAPGFLDWNSQRPRIAALIGEKLGTEMRISGDLRLSFLPVPSIDAEGVAFGSEDNPFFTAERFTASLALSALAGGAIRVTEARADRVRLVPEAMPPQPPRFEAMPPQAGIDRLDLRSVTLIIRNEVFSAGFDVTLEAPQLQGPFRLDIANPGAGRDFRAQIGKIEAGRARMKSLIEDKRLGFRASFDGQIGLPDGSGKPLFDGQVQFNGNPVLGRGEEAPQLPFEGSARLLIHPQQAVADPVNLSFGTGENAFFLAGQAFLDLAQPRIALNADLNAKRLDLVALLAPPPNRPAEKQDIATTLATFVSRLEALELPVDLALATTIGAIQSPIGLMTDFEVKAESRGKGLRLSRLAAKLPGATDIAYTRAERAGAALFDGRAELASQDPAALMVAIRGGEAVAGLPTTLRFSTGLISAPGKLDLPGLFIASDAGALSGNGALDLPDTAGSAPRLTLALSANRFDARVLAALDPLRSHGDLPVQSSLDIAALVLDGTVIGGLSVAIEREIGRSAIRQFRLRGVAGEELTLSGTISPDETRLTAKLDAERLEAIGRLTAALFPGPLSEALLKRATALSPALAVANIRIEPRAGDAHWDIVLDGRIGGSALAIKSQSTTIGNDLAVTIEGDITNEDGGRLLRQISGSTASTGPSLPGALKLKAEGNLRRLVRGTLRGTLAGIELDADGQFNPFRQGSWLEGRLTLQTGDLAVLHRALGGGAPRISEATRARFEGRYFAEAAKLTLTGFRARFGEQDVAGEISFDFARGGQVAGQLRMGALSLAPLLAPAFGPDAARLSGFDLPRQPLPNALAPLFAGDLWIEAKSMEVIDGITLQSPRFVLRFAPGLAAIEGFEAERDATRYAATTNFTRKGASIEAVGRISVQAATLAGVGGRLSAELPFTASGESLQALAASLGGAGRATLTGLTLREADAAALLRLIARPLDQLAPLDENRIGGLLETEMKAAPLAVPDLALPLTVINGQIRLSGGTLPASGPSGITLSPALTLDLPRAQLEARLGLRAASAPPGWRGAPPEIAIGWSGRLNDPNPRGGVRRQLNVSPLVNGLLAIQLQRDLERTELFEQDVRERASLLRRQRADQALERRRQELEAFEKAEADRKAREELETLLRQRSEAAPQPVAPAPSSAPLPLRQGAATGDPPAATGRPLPLAPR